MKDVKEAKRGRGRPRLSELGECSASSFSLLPGDLEFLQGEDKENGNANEGLRVLIKRLRASRKRKK